MSTLILRRSDVAALLEMDDCIRVVEDAFRQHATGTAVPPQVLGVHVEHGGFHVKAAALRTPKPYFAAKVNGNFSENGKRYGLPTIQGVIVLADLINGTPLAVLDSIEITIQRTAAATAVAAKYLARDAPTVLTMVGCGTQARAQLRGLCRVRTVSEIHAYDNDISAARRYVDDMTSSIGVPIHLSDDLQASLRRSDIVVTCTTARAPILRPGELKPGAFVAAVGADSPDKQEIDPALLASTTVVADVLEQSATIGDLHHAIAAGVLRRADVYAELGEVVSGRKAGRRSDEEVIVFDSTGMALQDVATSALVYERALERGVGQRVALGA
jgi:alanine dehydrogenase